MRLVAVASVGRLPIAEHMRADLTIEALKMAIRRRRPKAGLIHHSDQGVQYAALEYIAILLDLGIVPSMSRAGTQPITPPASAS